MNTSHLWIGLVAGAVLLVLALIISRGHLDKTSWLILLCGIAAVIFVALDWNALVPHIAPAQALPIHATPAIHHLSGQH